MKHLDILYYHSSESARNSYTKEPTGSFSVDRFLDHKPDFFIKNVVERKVSKKKIILNDWYNKWSSYDKTQLTSLYNYCFKEGFEIYGMADDGKLKKLSKPEAFNYQYQTPPKDNLLKAAADKGFTRDETIVLGPVELSQILTIDIRISHGKLLTDPAQLKELQSAVDSDDTRVVFDVIKTLLQEEFAFIQKYCNGLGYVPLKTPDIRLQSLKHLRFLYMCYANIGLNEILESWPNLKELRLNDCKNHTITREMKFPKTLENLYLSSSDIDDITLNNILKSSPNLKELSLSYCKNLTLTGEIKFPETLENLDLSNNELRDIQLNNILASCPNLNTLILRCSKNLTLTGEIKFPKTLENLDLYDGELSDIQLNNILESCPNLKTLTLDNSKKLILTGKIKFPKTLENLKLDKELSLDTIQELQKSHPLLTIQIDDHLYHPSSVAYTGPTGFSQAASPIDTAQPTGATDYDTGPSNSTLTQNEYFKPKTDVTINYHNCRNTVFTDINPDNGEKKSDTTPSRVEIAPTHGLESEYDEKYAKSPNIFLGLLTIGSDGTYAIPSLTAQHKLQSIELADPNAKLEVSYSNETNQYYATIRGLSPGKGSDLFFMIEDAQLLLSEFPLKEGMELPDKLSLDHPPAELPNPEENIARLVQYCSSFVVKPLEVKEGASPSLKDIIEQKAGVCRHRSDAFKAMADRLGIKSRICVNNIHQWCEVWNQEKWNSIDLGGGPAQVQLNSPKWGIIPQAQEILEEPVLKKDVEFNALTELTKADGIRNILCKVPEVKIEDFMAAAARSKDGIYVISDMDEIRQLNVIIKEDGSTAREDSELAKFLKKPGGILVIDWSQMKSEHVGYNSILDTTRMLGGHEIDEKLGLKVISVVLENAELGKDFTSRHQDVVDQVLNIPDKTEVTSKMPETKTDEICFYDNNWHGQLLGQVSINPEGQYEYITGVLESLLKEGKSDIALRNAPWHDREFRLAIDKISNTEQFISNGQTISARGVKFRMLEKAYDTSALQIAEYDPKAEYTIINRGNIKKFLNPYYISDGLVKKPSVDLSKPLLITEEISNGEFAQLSLLSANIVRSQSNLLSSRQNEVIITNDLGLCSKLELGESTTASQVVFINEETLYSDLVENISYKEGEFTHNRSEVADKIAKGENVTLVGNPSPELSRLLQSLFVEPPYLIINGERVPAKGSLKLVCEKSVGFESFKIKEKPLGEKEIWQQLDKEYKGKAEGPVAQLHDYLERLSKAKLPLEFSYTQLKSALDRMDYKPGSNPIKHLLRLRTDYTKIKDILDREFKAGQASGLVKSPREQKDRVTKVKEELEHSPYVFLVGPSGSGKSRVVQKELAKTYDVIEGMEDLEKFVDKSSGKPKLLFLDEANLEHNPQIFGVFEGLFSGDRKILVKGKLVEVPEGNKIVFAGNYGHFKGRKAVKLVENYGHAIPFKALTHKEIETQVVGPLVDKIFSSETAAERDALRANLITAIV